MGCKMKETVFFKVSFLMVSATIKVVKDQYIPCKYQRNRPWKNIL